MSNYEMQQKALIRSLQVLLDRCTGPEWHEWIPELARFNNRHECWAPDSKPPVLELLDVVSVPARESFDASKHFRPGCDNPGGVRIKTFGDACHVDWDRSGDDFVARFIPKIEESVRASNLLIYRTTQEIDNYPDDNLFDFSDVPVLSEMRRNTLTYLSDIWALLEKQPNGEDGVLGMCGVFFVHDRENFLWRLEVFWDEGWGLMAIPIFRTQHPKDSCIVGRQRPEIERSDD